MLYQITGHGWPIGAHLIPTGTIINSSGTDQWSQLAKDLPPPLNSMPLDWETWQELKRLYPTLIHLIVTPAGKER
jgi:hypothetical protein